MASSLLEHARALDAEIRELGRRENALQAEIAFRLRRMKEEGLHPLLGKSTIAAYARAALGYSGSKTRDLIALAKRLDSGLEKMKQAFVSGELEWTKARSASSVATPETEDEWIEKTRHLSSRQLEMAAKEERGEEPRTRRSFDLTAEEQAWLDDALHAIRKESRRALNDTEAFVELLRRALSREGGVGGPRFRVVIYLCGRCEEAKRTTNDGEVAVDRADVEEALCDAEVLDVTDGKPKALTRTMPPKVSNLVEARFRGRCATPDCNNRVDLDRHHEGGWRKVGHDPDLCMLLCGACHGARHRGELIIEGRYPDFVFKLCDGTVLEPSGGSKGPSREALPHASREAPTDASRAPTDASRAPTDASRAPTDASRAPTDASREAPTDASRGSLLDASREAEGASHEAACASPEAPAAASREAPPVASREALQGASRETAISRRELDETARAALRSLGMKPREAEAAVRRARAMLAAPPEDLTALLAAALRK